MTDPGQTPPQTPDAAELQFDRVEPTASANAASTSNTAGMLCPACGSTILDEYYSVGAKSICSTCRTSFEATRATSHTPKAFGKALGFGFIAALAGAVVYYAVIALFDLEIGIVAILIGWMVGRAIQKALPGGGSRRYQVLAAVLTYFAVGVAYMPVLFTAMNKDAATKKQDSTAVVTLQGKPVTPPVVPTKADVKDADQGKSGSVLFGIGALIVLAFSLPVVTAFSSGGGIISALIIGIGIRQAWRMSGAPALAITGPFRVGGTAMTPNAS